MSDMAALQIAGAFVLTLMAVCRLVDIARLRLPAYGDLRLILLAFIAAFDLFLGLTLL